MQELFDEKTWYGTFSPHRDWSNSFSGELKYDCFEGLRLSFTIPGQKLPSKTNVLYALLNSGDVCTVFCDFPPEGVGKQIRNGVYTHFGTIGVKFCVMGIMLKGDEKIKSIMFSLTNFPEFIFASGFKDMIPFTQEPMHHVNKNHMEIFIEMSATMKMLSDDLRGRVYCLNSDASEELQEKFTEVRQKYSDSSFLLKENIETRIRINFHANVMVGRAISEAFEISNLFAILKFGPVRPEKLTIRLTDEQEDVYTVYVSEILNNQTKRLMDDELSHHNLPINANKVDLAKVLEAWVEAKETKATLFKWEKSFDTIVSRIQNETGWRDLHSVFGGISLYTMLLEEIAEKEGVTANDKKINYTIGEYADAVLQDALSLWLAKKKQKSLGNQITLLRNEILHPGKPRKLLLSLTLKDLANAEICLQLCVLGYILRKLHIKRDVMSVYQTRFLPS